MQASLRRRISEAIIRWTTRATVWVVRASLRLRARAGKGEQRDQARDILSALDALGGLTERIAPATGGKRVSALDVLEETAAKRGDSRSRESVDRIRVMLQENEELRAISARVKDDHALAAKEYARFADAHPRSALARQLQGTALQSLGDTDGSLAAFRKAVKIAGADTVPGVSARLNVGRALQLRGDVDAAVKEFRATAESLSPETEPLAAGVYLYLGDALAARGSRGEAEEAWQEAARRDQSNTVVKMARERLRRAS
jgi:tetratricopeptide (TPR) repeat protein